MELRKSTVEIVLILSLNILAVAIWFFVYIQITENSTAIVINKKNLTFIEQELINNIALKSIILDDKTKEDREKINSFFVKSDEETVDFLENVEALANSLNLEINIVSVNVLDIDENNQILDLNLKITGSFNSVYDFISLIDSLPYELSLDKFNMNSSVNVNEAGVENFEWSGNLSLALLSYQPE